MKNESLFMKRKKFKDIGFLYQCVVFRKTAKIGYKFNTVVTHDPNKKQFEIIKISKNYISVIDKNDAVKVWCRYLDV